MGDVPDNEYGSVQVRRKLLDDAAEGRQSTGGASHHNNIAVRHKTSFFLRSSANAGRHAILFSIKQKKPKAARPSMDSGVLEPKSVCYSACYVMPVKACPVLTIIGTGIQ